MTDTQKQCLLKYLGYYGGAVDGIFGPATEGNVRRYQRNFGLAQDGIVGPLTWESLTKEYARITGVS